MKPGIFCDSDKRQNGDQNKIVTFTVGDLHGKTAWNTIHYALFMNTFSLRIEIL